MKRVTRKKVDVFLKKQRPSISTYEDAWGNKGTYREDAGPAASFQKIGRTWREVLENFSR